MYAWELDLQGCLRTYDADTAKVTADMEHDFGFMAGWPGWLAAPTGFEPVPPP